MTCVLISALALLCSCLCQGKVMGARGPAVVSGGGISLRPQTNSFLDFGPAISKIVPLARSEWFLNLVQIRFHL